MIHPPHLASLETQRHDRLSVPIMSPHQSKAGFLGTEIVSRKNRRVVGGELLYGGFVYADHLVYMCRAVRIAESEDHFVFVLAYLL